MKTHPYTRILGVACAAVLASCASSPQPQTTRVPVSASLRTNNPIANLVYQEVNNYRQSQGRSALQRHPGLDRLAQEHCEYLRKHRGSFSLSGKNVSHFGFEGRAFYARERLSMNSVSENVAATSRSSKNPAPVLLELWKNSKSHHQNLLDGWTHTGVGVVVDSDGMVFSTQLFATQGGSQSPLAMSERFSRY